MKNRVVLAVVLTALLSFGMAGLSFARGTGMGGGVSGGGNSFHSSRQGISAPTQRHEQQYRVRDTESIRQHSQDWDRDRDQIHEQIREQTQDRDLDRDRIRNRDGQPEAANGGQADSHHATPAMPAQPGPPGEGATPAIPAAPAGN